jgi:hypothetical protein
VGKNSILWIATIVITLSSVFYQLRTSPAYPANGEITIDGTVISYSFPRTYDAGQNAPVIIPTHGLDFNAELQYRRYRSNDDWTTVPMERNEGVLRAYIPQQPPAGKVMYIVTLIAKDGHRKPLTAGPVIIRFKGYIPLGIFLPHILFMFTSMLLGTRTGLEAVVEGPRARVFAWWTLGLLFAGGLILGPIVQKYAFDALWTGWPFGHDLTDNKTLVAVLGWVWALWKNRVPSDKNRKWYWIAAIIHLTIYLIPHSALGSELDYTNMPS